MCWISWEKKMIVFPLNISFFPLTFSLYRDIVFERNGCQTKDIAMHCISSGNLPWLHFVRLYWYQSMTLPFGELFSPIYTAPPWQLVLTLSQIPPYIQTIWPLPPLRVSEWLTWVTCLGIVRAALRPSCKETQRQPNIKQTSPTMKIQTKPLWHK